MMWTVGQTGRTFGGISFRIIATDARGDRGSLVALLSINDEEMVFRYPSTGLHPGGHRAYNLMPVTVPA